MPSVYLVGVDDRRHATDVRAFDAETGELLDVDDLGPVVAYRVVIDATPGTQIPARAVVLIEPTLAAWRIPTKSLDTTPSEFV